MSRPSRNLGASQAFAGGQHLRVTSVLGLGVPCVAALAEGPGPPAFLGLGFDQREAAHTPAPYLQGRPSDGLCCDSGVRWGQPHSRPTGGERVSPTGAMPSRADFLRLNAERKVTDATVCCEL